ncbi:MAG TPA: cysteine desulfurase family protein [Longimicrobiales bacterium]|nr:cysteine desulfurase family protein [Longimicrobiales bacterium]
MHPIYLDHAATTPVRAEVRAAMEPFLDRTFGNPSSLHRWGREAAAALAEARAACAATLGARFSEIHFVRGGTESDNLAIQGRATRLRADGHTPTVAVSTVEHAAVLGAADHATARGAGRMVSIPVAEDGSLDQDRLAHALAEPPALVSIMWVNNETGMVLPVEEVAARCRATGATFHTDAVQAVGKMPVRVDEVPVDLLTATGHKLQGPKGTGLLFCREGTYLSPLLHGGGQERALRPGTEDVAGAVGLATALRLAVEEREAEAERLGALRARLEGELATRIAGMRVNGGRAPRAPHIASISVPGVDSTSLLMALDLEGVAVSGGAACHTGASSGSHVLAALYGAGDPHATVRFSLGASTTAEDVIRAAGVTASVVERLRALESGA